MTEVVFDNAAVLAVGGAALPAGPMLASERELLRAFAGSGGVRWAALLEPDLSLRAIEAAVPAAALAAVNAMLAMLRCDAAATPTESFVAETTHAITLAQPLVSAPQWIAVQFDKAVISEPLARLLMTSMVAEIDPQDTA